MSGGHWVRIAPKKWKYVRDVKKYNHNHDPDDGRFTHGPGGARTYTPPTRREFSTTPKGPFSPGRGIAFVSPERRTGRTLTDARADLTLAQQTRLRAAVRSINERLGIQHAKTKDGLGVWTDPVEGVGAEASTMTVTSSDASLDDLEASAAMSGWLSEQKGVIAFKVGTEGSDVLLNVTGLRGAPEDLYRSFKERGVENITLVPRPDGLFDAHTIALDEWGGTDAQKAIMDGVQQVARGRGAQYTISSGEGRYVGADTRAEARTAYEAVIERYRSQARVTPRTRSESRDGGRDRLGWWDDLARKWRAGQANRGESLAKRLIMQVGEVLDVWIAKFNPYHDPDDGRFTHGPGGSGYLAPRRFGARSLGADDVIEADAHALAGDIVRMNNVFSPLSKATRLTYRNIAVDNLYADMASAGTMRRAPTDAQWRAALLEAHPDFEATDRDLVAMRKSYEKLKEAYRDTRVPHWGKELQELAKEGLSEGGQWYNHEGTLIDRVFSPTDARVFRAFLGVTSPNSNLEFNLTKALSFYAQWRANGRQVPDDGFVGATGSESRAAARLLKDGVSSGSKVGQFIAALEGDLDAVVVDVWMARAFGLKTTQAMKDENGKLLRGEDGKPLTRRVQAGAPNDRGFRIVSRIIRNQAAKMGVAPRALQAAIWVALKRRVEGPNTLVSGFDELLAERARRNDLPDFKGRGANRRYTVTPLSDLHTMISASSAVTWRRLQKIDAAPRILRGLQQSVLRDVLKAIDPRLRVYAAMIAIETLASHGDERAWRRRMVRDVGEDQAQNLTWQGALEEARWIVEVMTLMGDDVLTNEDVQKFNPNHDDLGRFSTAHGAGAGDTRRYRPERVREAYIRASMEPMGAGKWEADLVEHNFDYDGRDAAELWLTHGGRALIGGHDVYAPSIPLIDDRGGVTDVTDQLLRDGHARVSVLPGRLILRTSTAMTPAQERGLERLLNHWGDRVDTEVELLSPNGRRAIDATEMSMASAEDILRFLRRVRKFNPYHDPDDGRFTTATMRGFNAQGGVSERSGYLTGITDHKASLTTVPVTKHEKLLQRTWDRMVESMPMTVQQRIDSAEVFFLSMTKDNGKLATIKDIGFFAAYSPMKGVVMNDQNDAMALTMGMRTSNAPAPTNMDSFLVTGQWQYPKDGVYSREALRDAILRHEVGHMIDRVLLERAVPGTPGRMATMNTLFSETDEGHPFMGRALNADINRNKALGTEDNADRFLMRWVQSQDAKGRLVVSAAEQFADAAAYLLGARRIRLESALRFRRAFPNTIRMVARMIKRHAPDIAEGFQRQPPTGVESRAFQTRVGKSDGRVFVLGPPSEKSVRRDAEGNIVLRVETPEAWT